MKWPKSVFPFMGFPHGNKTVPLAWDRVARPPQAPQRTTKILHLLSWPIWGESACLIQNLYFSQERSVLQENVVAPSRLWVPRTSVPHYFPVHGVTVSLRFEYISHINSDLHKITSLSCRRRLEIYQPELTYTKDPCFFKFPSPLSSWCRMSAGAPTITCEFQSTGWKKRGTLSHF